MEGMRVKRVRYISRSREEVSESLKRELKEWSALALRTPWSARNLLREN